MGPEVLRPGGPWNASSWVRHRAMAPQVAGVGRDRGSDSKHQRVELSVKIGTVRAPADWGEAAEAGPANPRPRG